jgi:hypothetical protein
MMIGIVRTNCIRIARPIQCCRPASIPVFAAPVAMRQRVIATRYPSGGAASKSRCAAAGSGHDAAPVRPAMNSRRRIRYPSDGSRAYRGRGYMSGVLSFLSISISGQLLLSRGHARVPTCVLPALSPTSAGCPTRRRRGGAAHGAAEPRRLPRRSISAGRAFTGHCEPAAPSLPSAPHRNRTDRAGRPWADSVAKVEKSGVSKIDARAGATRKRCSKAS